MTPREAVARAMARHVWENDEQFEEHVDTFIEDLKACGYEVAEREPEEEERSQLLIDMWRGVKTPDPPTEPKEGP